MTPKPSFSRRNGYKAQPVLQLESMDEQLQNVLWNVISRYIDFLRSRAPDYSFASRFITRVWDGHFGRSLDEISNVSHGEKVLRTVFYNLTWNEVYDLIEFIVVSEGELRRPLNDALTRQHAAYQISDEGMVLAVTNATQLEAINTATKETSGIESVHSHLVTAQQLFSNREKPDQYGPSIGESISAVETLAKMMVAHVPKPVNSLAAALKLFPEAGIKLPSQLLDSWSDTWGYTCDRAGIRHGKPNDTTGTEISQAEALYMLVKSSAFVSYLLHLAREANVKF